jgi:16S rRNA processing protein RimM
MDRFNAIEAGSFLSSVSQIEPSGGSMSGSRRVLLGRIGSAHGLKGEFVVHSFAEVPEDIAAYGPLTDAAGQRTFDFAVVRVTDKGVIARVAGVTDRTQAETLKGTELWVERDQLGEAEEGEFYHADLIGLSAVAPGGQPIGQIVAVQNYGAGDLLEIRLVGSRRTELVAFTDAFVPEVDLAVGRIVVRLPEAEPNHDGIENEDGEPT